MSVEASPVRGIPTSSVCATQLESLTSVLTNHLPHALDKYAVREWGKHCRWWCVFHATGDEDQGCTLEHAAGWAHDLQRRGRDLSGVWPAFAVWLLTDPEWGLAARTHSELPRDEWLHAGIALVAEAYAQGTYGSTDADVSVVERHRVTMASGSAWDKMLRRYHGGAATVDWDTQQARAERCIAHAWCARNGSAAAAFAWIERYETDEMDIAQRRRGFAVASAIKLGELLDAAPGVTSTMTRETA